MSPLNNEQTESIVKRIAFIELELRDLDEYRHLVFEVYQGDRKTQRNIERILENIANAAIDIAKIILASEEIAMPQTYRETFEKLSEIDILDESLAKELAHLSRTRNVLAHQYLDIKWEMINDFLVSGRYRIEEFLQIVRERI